MWSCTAIITHLQSILIRDLQSSGVVCTVTNTLISTHTHTHTRKNTHSHKHNNVCLYCFSREQRHFQAGIIFSPAEYLPRTFLCACVFEKERVCVYYILAFWVSAIHIRKRKKNCIVVLLFGLKLKEQDVFFLKNWTEDFEAGLRFKKEWTLNIQIKRPKAIYITFFLINKCSFGYFRRHNAKQISQMSSQVGFYLSEPVQEVMCFTFQAATTVCLH